MGEINKMKNLMVVVMLITATSWASFVGKDSSGVDVGHFSSLKCAASLGSCTKSSGDFLIDVFGSGGVFTMSDSETMTNASDVITFAYDDAAANFKISAFEATNSNLYLIADESDDNGDDWMLSSVASNNSFTFSNDSSGSQSTITTVSKDGDWTFAGTTPYLIIGDSGEEDAGLQFAGNAQSYNISLDDSADDLVIGLGVAAGTTDALRIDENQDVTVVQDLLPLSTITGDGGAALVGMLNNQVASASATLTIAQCGSTIVSNSADVEVLPEASTALGCRYTFVCGTADDFDVNPNDGTDTIGNYSYISGTNTTVDVTPSAGDAIRCTDIGDGFVLEAVGADLWAVISVMGVITDVN